MDLPAPIHDTPTADKESGQSTKMQRAMKRAMKKRVTCSFSSYKNGMTHIKKSTLLQI